MTSWDGGTLDEREYLIVRGTVQQIVYYNDENGYAVLRLAAENGAEVTATGTFPNIGLGEEVILTGCWVTHPTYGEQFATEAFERRLPTSVRGIAEYLGSGLIRGIGPRLAAKIAEKFGEDTFDILMHERMSPKGDTFVGKLQRMVVAIDGEIIIKVKTSGFGIDKELNGRTVTDRKEARGEDSRTMPNKKAARLSGLSI